MYEKWPSFDELKKLAEQSPEKLEEFRERQVQALIEQAPERIRKRLQGLQFQINCQRELHKTPLASCIAISQMMHESLAKLNEAFSANHADTSFNERNDNNVIPFAG
ncbi:DUF3135 domain-containing protein [Agarilytica rhodophyticola]|uniref:DUF3135 domain-containing protein n=1 Tax=Agarilytica rhodophyticola TaxID=1737490 RepID=UPI000B349E79|nr:DUF3135 domain-containing protein [Agarilytica rhodophyticola]